MEGLKVSNANFVVYVHPSKSKEVSEVFLLELSSLLFGFSEIFDGVVLAYDFNSLDKCAKILPGVHPYFGVRLKANLLLFSPKPDMLLEGKVVKLSQESIHVVVLGFSSAIIIDKIVGEMSNTKLVDEEILHVYGSLIPDHTGSIHWLDKNMEFVSNTDRSAIKRGSEGEPIMLEQDSFSGKPSTLDTVQKVKKSKKQKIRAES